LSLLYAVCDAALIPGDQVDETLVFALDLDPNAYAGGMTRDELFVAIKGHILAESSVIATYAR